MTSHLDDPLALVWDRKVPWSGGTLLLCSLGPVTGPSVGGPLFSGGVQKFDWTEKTFYRIEQKFDWEGKNLNQLSKNFYQIEQIFDWIKQKFNLRSKTFNWKELAGRFN